MLFDFANRRLIEKSVGNNMVNEDEDVRHVKGALSRIGLFDQSVAPEPHGIITHEMDTAIKGFQGAKGLKIDGVLEPGGETETAIVGSFFAHPKAV